MSHRSSAASLRAFYTVYRDPDPRRSLLTVFAVSLVMALATPETGLVERVALVAMFGGCVFLAARVTTMAERLSQHVQGL